MLRIVARSILGCKVNSHSVRPLATCIPATRPVPSIQISVQSSDFKPQRCIHSTSASREKAEVNVVFKFSDGQRFGIKAHEGDSLLNVVNNNKDKMEIFSYGICEGTVSCSTCHVMFSPKDFERLNPLTMEEEDVLECAYNATPCSRLGCQVILTKEMEGLEISLPDMIVDIRYPEESTDASK